MRSLVVREALTEMAGDAALRLRELLAAGEEVPYEVHEAGGDSPLVQYTPKTSAFIRDRSELLNGIDSFGTACAVLEDADLASRYLDSFGIAIPPEPRRRAELAGVAFLCRLWRGSTDFTLDDARLTATIEEILAAGEAEQGEIEIIVPLRGFQMPVSRLELGEVTVVRADTVEVPNEARAHEGMGGAEWEPTFLAVARVDSRLDEGDASEIGIRAVESFRRLITALRLHKAGGVALGPHAWTKAGGDRWRRIATGAGKPSPGGYRLADTELQTISAFAAALGAPSTPFGRGNEGFPGVLTRAISRFEAGVERPVALEALNDFLLAARFLLEGGGPADLGLSMRVAALCAEPDERDSVRSSVERAVSLERELWSGEPATTVATPAEIVGEVEDLIRAILKDAACGHLGTDLRATADEILLADGLAAGEGAASERGGTAEWQVPDLSEAEISVERTAEKLGPSPEPIAGQIGEEIGDVDLADELGFDDDERSAAEGIEEPVPAEDEPHPETVAEKVQRLMFERTDLAAVADLADDPAAEPNDDFESVDAFQPEELEFFSAAEDFEPVKRERPAEPVTAREPHDVPRPTLRAVADGEGPVARLIADSDAHRRDVADRVSFLFPEPETCEWGVREVGYDRTRRAEITGA